MLNAPVFDHANDLQNEHNEEEDDEDKTKWFTFDWVTITAVEQRDGSDMKLEHEVEEQPDNVDHPEPETCTVLQGNQIPLDLFFSLLVLLDRPEVFVDQSLPELLLLVVQGDHLNDVIRFNEKQKQEVPP